MWVVVRRAASRPPGVRRNRCDTELKLVLFACGGWHNSSLSRSFRRQMTVVEIIITVRAVLSCVSGEVKARQRAGGVPDSTFAFTWYQMTQHIDDYRCSVE